MFCEITAGQLPRSSLALSLSLTHTQANKNYAKGKKSNYSILSLLTMQKAFISINTVLSYVTGRVNFNNAGKHNYALVTKDADGLLI
jgi:hypothetical protein